MRPAGCRREEREVIIFTTSHGTGPQGDNDNGDNYNDNNLMTDITRRSASPGGEVRGEFN